MTQTKYLALLVALVLLPAALAQPAPEPNTVGDIPDTQAFVHYSNPTGGYSLEVPEGWSRSTVGTDTTFTAKLNTVSVTERPAKTAPTAVSVRATEVVALTASDPDVKVKSVSGVKLPAGRAVLVRFDSTSAPNDVTSRRSPLENDLYVLFSKGREVLLRLSAPRGADNVDAWNRMAGSFRWK